MGVTTGITASPALPATRKPTAISCSVVFHLASWVTGTLTRNSARYSRRPDTRISRHRMTIAAHSDQPRIVPSAASISRHEATRSLSAIGSSIRPKVDCSPHLRAR